MVLSGKHVVVTGASSGIGQGIAEIMAQKGAAVVAAARGSTKAQFTAPKIIPAAADLRSPEHIDGLIDFARQTMGSIDVFVANAGFGYYGKTNADWASMEDIFKLNVLSPIYSLTKLCAEFAKKPIYFVLMDSGAGRMPLPGYSLYCATKFALDGFIRSFRFELPSNVRLSVVYPAGVDTAFYEKAAPDAPAPRPVQALQRAAENIVKGIEEEKAEIYPSAAFPVLMLANRFFPFVEAVYHRYEKKRFGNWLRTHGNGRI